MPSKFQYTISRKFRRGNGHQRIATPLRFMGLIHLKMVLKSKCPRRRETLIRFGTDCLQKYVGFIKSKEGLACVSHSITLIHPAYYCRQSVPNLISVKAVFKKAWLSCFPYPIEIYTWVFTMIFSNKYFTKKVITDI